MTPERELQLWRGQAAANEMLCACGYRHVEKVDNPLRRRTFDRIVARISAELQAATSEQDVTFADRVLEALDVDFGDLTAAEREAAIAEAVSALPVAARYATLVRPVFAAELTSLLTAARLAAFSDLREAARALGIEDFETLDALANGQSRYIASFMVKRNQELEKRFRAIIARAVDEGWRRQDVSRELEGLLKPTEILRRQRGYYDVVAGAAVGYTRTYGQLSAFRDAGIERYIWESVLDEVTTDVCRFMHGHVFEVGAALDVFSRMATHLDAAKEAAPWLRMGRNADGQTILYTKTDSTRREIAVVVRSGVGRKDDQGQFSTVYDAARLQALGVCLPPAHGNCRSTIVADV